MKNSTKKKKAQLLQRLEELAEELDSTIEALQALEMEEQSSKQPSKKNSTFTDGTRVGIITEPYKGKLGKITGKRSKPTTAPNGPSTYWYIALDGADPTAEPIWKMEKNLRILEHQRL